MRLGFFAQICLAIVAVTSSISSPTRAALFEEVCQNPRPLAVGGTVSMDGLEAGTTALFSLEVPAPGRLAVEVTVPAVEPAVAWLEFLPFDCARDRKWPALILEHSMSRRVLTLAEAGTYHFRVGVVSPEHRLPGYKLSSRFLAANPSEILTKDGDPGDDTEEGDNEILPLVGGVPAWTGTGCAKGIEPANDLSFCAIRLPPNVMVKGELESSTCNDHDYFTFELQRARRIQISTRGTTDTFGTLYDEYGHRLMADDDSGDDNNFALVATLSPGRYSIRVEGALDSQGAYELTLASSDQGWPPHKDW